ncbi:DUF1161 domain-containing protein [Caldimonas thermodepolymerans]|jgi:glycine/D-amino acid oxidase-like deaminating enzyme|nr:DUF1161 domain-containing protein [Caldimonas thermodepolymerans]QPC32081.1 DUF1161 domain-containing protein [Caldimonas thermodepolymerans]RDH95905.1 uncharacterized protein DUF1161 [Caldimonas thermodepolymerans]TCP08268.1 uncharacterized protein DUF1161 [Caldimonas thermodepolymerans]UZG44876.1 DUF1161 domain-containing protein [Caldimonas thermodepolymerans]UZG48619.1 DUF1161 domain-containing protein [Caldimonas thermodepolymerans]
MNTASASRLVLSLCLVAAAALPAVVWAERLECDALVEQIEAKLQANGVRHYRLDVVDADAEAQGRVVGTCNGGTAKIVYQRVPKAHAQKTRAMT